MSSRDLGTLVVTILEIRDVSASYVQIKEEFTLATTPKFKNSKALVFKDNNSYEFPIQKPKEHLTVRVLKKAPIGFISDKVIRFLQIPVERLLVPKVEPEWYPLHPVPEKFDDSVLIDVEKEEENPKHPNGKIRLSFEFIEAKVVEEKIDGKTCEGEWTKETSGGLINATPTWYDNPQFLLTVAKESEISIHLRQEDKKARATFFILKYDNDSYLGRRITTFKLEDIKKVDKDFLSPIVARNTVITETFIEGSYVIIPTTENPGTAGKFTLIAATKNLNNIELEELPRTGEKGWKELKIEGEWKDSGGSDVNGLTWYKNPQYLFHIKETTDLAIQLNQPAAEYSIGFYIFDLMLDEDEDEEIDYSKIKKISIYKNCCGKTDSCKYVYSCGTIMKDVMPGAYVAIPVTYSSHIDSNFTLRAFASEESGIEYFELTDDYAHSESILSRWEGERAAGGPNEEDYVNNPQYEVEVDNSDSEKDLPVVLHLSQGMNDKSEFNSIGIYVFKKDEDDEDGPLEIADPEKVVAKSAKFINHHSIELIFKIKAGKTKKYVIIPSTFKPNCEGDFRLTILSDAKSISYKRLTEGDVEPEIKEQKQGGMEEADREEVPEQRREKEEKKKEKKDKKKEKEEEKKEEEKEEKKEEKEEKKEEKEEEKEEEKKEEEKEEKEEKEEEKKEEKEGSKKKKSHHHHHKEK